MFLLCHIVIFFSLKSYSFVTCILAPYPIATFKQPSSKKTDTLYVPHSIKKQRLTNSQSLPRVSKTNDNYFL